VTGAHAQSARFDLTGPKVEVRVTRAGVTLPIASVPNLQPGDRLWLHPDLPPSQSVRYLMVLAFLRGTTNPPPDKWFTRVPTWEKKVREEGVEVTVPEEAQEAVLFLAPVTGGDFTTLRSAVQGRPGIFVRASQDLAAAGFEQARIEKYIASMRQLSPMEAADPKQLQEHSNLLAATLALKPNGDCIKLPPDQQYTCLTQSGSQNLLDDGHGQSIIDALTGGTGAGLIGTVSSTQLAGGGVYSAYVGAIIDLVHIMGSLHTAQYQYIPAIAFPQQQSMNLRLNMPPSFHNPKSVIVIGLPSVQKTIPPPLRAENPSQVSCLQKPDVVLPVEGAPLVFSTSFAHDLVLHLNYPQGANPEQPQDIPLTPDAFRGGLVLATTPQRRVLPEAKNSAPSASTSSPNVVEKGGSPASPIPAGADITGTVKGFWGFDTFTGPTMPLQEIPGKDWKLAGNDPADAWVIAGKGRHILLTSTGTACVRSVALDLGPGKEEPQTWKAADKPNAVDVTLDVPAHESASLHLAIHQFGDSKAATVGIVSYNEPAKLEALHFHTGDTIATLSGSGIGQVRQVQFGDLTFKPEAAPIEESGKPELRLALASDHKSPMLPVGATLSAHVTLEDGRKISLPVTVEPARPVITLIGHADVPPDTIPKGQLHIQLASENDLPVSDALIFSLKSAQPFPRAGTVDIATPDGALHTKLSLSDADPKASLILQDPQTLLGTLQPLKAFGASAFGPIHLRAVAPDGVAGDWLPLVTLVRLPTVSGLSCPVTTPAVPAQPSNPSPATDGSEVPASSSAAAPGGAGSNSPAPATLAGPAPPAPCVLTGSGLYFIDAIATDAAFTHFIRVPEGFVGSSLAVPPPTGAVYYLRLRDDPTAVDTVNLPAGPL
jgi:hypothetical protein